MPPKSRGKPLPSGFQSKSTSNLPTRRSQNLEEPLNEPVQPISPPSPTPHTSPSDPTSVKDNLQNDDDDDDDQDEAVFETDASEGSESDGANDGPPEHRTLYKSRSYTQLLPPTTSTLFPPFYNRPPVPLPPSPSLTSLLRPSFSTTTSRPTTPDSSDVDVSGAVTNGTSTPASTTNLASITKSARHAPLVPRASPKVPTYEYYGFALYLASSAAFLLYIVWAYVPSPLLHQMGIHYYPNRWWALAVPCWLVVLVMYIYVALASYNTRYLTLPMSSCENLVDETAQVALIDRRTGKIKAAPWCLASDRCQFLTNPVWSTRTIKMQFTVALTLASALASAEAAETVLGAYMFHRHGDRTPKALAPTNLTTLGYEQVYTSGQYYRSRYLTGDSKIKGLNQDTVKLTQLAVTAPVDNVLQNSAQGFLQGLYPPVRTVQTLANKTEVQAPMDGYQLIPINTVDTGAGSEDSGWLQDASSCANAKTSSNSFFSSAEYNDILNKTKDFYSALTPRCEQHIRRANAYVIYDLINVAEIHNSSIPSSDVLTNDTLFQIRTLADTHEYGLAYNASDNMRAISGMQLAGEIIKYMNTTIKSGQSGSSANKFGIQFGAYATFLSFFGLADLPKADSNFYGVPDYASSMVFELFTDADTSNGFPKTDDLQVRFLFHNGTSSNSSEPKVYPLFGGSDNAISWNDFNTNLNKFAVSNTEQWCTKCGNTTGKCAPYAPGSDDPSTTENNNNGGSHMSAAIGGVIGAFVTLAVVLGGLAAFMLLGGYRLASKKALGARAPPTTEVTGSKV
ncbi:hypothetical protein N0V90_001767 [Kalmusia sp. IMI 367209]|nr:hypothetical protein N0V90_001767 [Kalmusia sp. IMI 367209]